MKIPHVYLDDMIEAIVLINKYLSSIDEVQFSRDTALQDAVIRRLTIIGEAATKLPDEIKQQAPDVPWKTIIGFRNVAIHDYATTSMGKVWEIYKQDLPPLFAQIKKLLQTIPPPPDPKSL